MAGTAGGLPSPQSPVLREPRAKPLPSWDRLNLLSSARLALHRAPSAFQIGTRAIHRSSAETSAGGPRAHPERPPSFRRQRQPTSRWDLFGRQCLPSGNAAGGGESLSPPPSAARQPRWELTRRCFRRRIPPVPPVKARTAHHCLAVRPPRSRGLLRCSTLIRLRRLDHLLTMQAPVITPEATVLARLVRTFARSVTSVGPFFLARTRECTPWTSVPASFAWMGTTHDFSRQKAETSAYPSLWGFSVSAPSPIALTGKGFRPFHR